MSDTNHSHTFSGSTGADATGSATGSHTHTFTTSSINGNVAQSAFMPAYSARNEFVFLGNLCGLVKKRKTEKPAYSGITQ